MKFHPILLFLFSFLFMNPIYSQDISGQVSLPTSKIAQELAKCNQVEDRQIGEGGEYSKVYAWFEELLKIASDQDLVHLMNHRSPIVRAYAFHGLAKRNYSDIPALLTQHIKDTTEISYQSGCLVYTYPIRNFYFDLVATDHIDGSCFKMSPANVEKFTQLIN